MSPVQCYPKNQIINGRYQVIKPLGEGAMSAVYLVRDLRLRGAEWALKELKASLIPPSDRTASLEQFSREAEILGKLNHPGLPQLIDYYSDGSTNNYIVMERVRGKTLDEVLGGRILPLRSEEAVPIALQTAHVIDYLHTQDPPIIFRDLKPSNLMLTDSGRVCFIDFGIARFYSAAQEKDTQELGTPGFCAPEQYRGHSNLRSDLYSLGITLFYLLTLKDPQSFNFSFPPLSTLNPSVPQQLDTILERCLQIDPEKRYSSASELSRDLERTLSDMHSAPSGSTRPLEPALLALSHHYQRVPQPGWRSAWQFWKTWCSTILGPVKKRPN
ncbi:serine/threonine protein kinase [bacterium]|nr:serine/threonine protein kinase [bacterium]